MNGPVAISLPRFEGPLDLLLELVRKNEVQITDIPIAEITRQYLEYLRQAEQLDIELGAEFAYMASVLIHIKSRSLLTRDPEIAAQEEDPRDELVRMLLDHDQVRHGAEFLKQKLEVAEASWSKSSMHDFQELPAVEPNASGEFNLLQILRLAKQALDAARTFEIVSQTESVTIEEMIRWLEERIGEGSTDANQLLKQHKGERRAALFLALLEMAKIGRIQVDQKTCFGPIFIWHNRALT
ncbi:MAG TPA: segregation/condensation protein A [Candidatus Acidoferrum sp.]|nr:segregation/condensation protein A [Candidatus Acidoferrum sp.]